MAKKKKAKRAGGGKTNNEFQGERPNPQHQRKNRELRNGGSLTYWHFIVACVVASAAHFSFQRLRNPSTSMKANVGDPIRAGELRLLGLSLMNENRLQEAVATTKEAIKIDPYAPAGYNNLAGILRIQGKLTEALDILHEGDRVTAPYLGVDNKARHAIMQGLFHIYRDLGEDKKAAEFIEEAVALAPTASEAADAYTVWAGLKHIPASKKIELYDNALRIDPENFSAFCGKHHLHAELAEWDSLDREHAKVVDLMEMFTRSKAVTDKTCLRPYEMSYLNFSAGLIRDVSKAWVLREGRVGESERLVALRPSDFDPILGDNNKALRKLRVGYVSSDFSQHPSGRNMVGLFVAHDRNRFDVFTFATKHFENDPIAKTIMQYSNYIDLTKHQMSHVEVAKLIREKYKIDVLVDLNGWTAGKRLQLFAARPAPVQILHGFGYVATSGSNVFDYFIGDRIANPPRFDSFYTEKVLRLPYSYQVASHRTIHTTRFGENFNPANSDKVTLRREHDLPKDTDTFVFCSFQSIQKISADAFDTWMRILQGSASSVLWLLLKQEAKSNLIARARSKFNIDESRFVFADSMPVGQHLERAQACDLHLDSWPYNAHTTATDVLWAGVPLLVYLPDYHFPNAEADVPKMSARVSASLMHTLGMPQLIKSTKEEFTDEAIRLSQDTVSYNIIREELLRKRISSPLFDLRSYAKHHEVAYAEAFQRFYSGEEPAAFQIPDLIRP